MNGRNAWMLLLIVIVIQSIALLRTTMNRQDNITPQPPTSTKVIHHDNFPDLDLRIASLEEAVRELADEVRAKDIKATESAGFVADIQYGSKQGDDTLREAREAELDPNYMHANDLIQSYASSIKNPEDADKIIQAIAEVPNSKLQRSLLQQLNNRINRGW